VDQKKGQCDAASSAACPRSCGYCLHGDTDESVRSLVAFAQTNWAEYRWLKKDYKAAHAFSMRALRLDPFWEQWPFYCSKWQLYLGEQAKPDVHKSPEAKRFLKSWGEEITAVEQNTGVGRQELIDIVKELRRYECSDEFINMELENFYNPLDFKTSMESGARYTPQNYQYGTFFYNGFMQLFESRKIKPYITQAIKDNEEYLMLGANVGNEAFYGALQYGLRTRAIEIMCNLVEKAKSVKERFASKFDISFECMDCLKADISKAKVVYLDNEIWDNFLTTAIYEKMGTELPVGAIVMGWKPNVHNLEHGWEDMGSVGVLTSWSDDLQDVFVLRRVAERSVAKPQFTTEIAEKWFDGIVDGHPTLSASPFSFENLKNDLCEENIDSKTCSEVGKAIVVDTGKAFGKMLHINCHPSLSTADAFIFHEAVVHSTLSNVENPERILIAGGGDGGMASQVLKYQAVKELVVHELDSSVVELAKTQLPYWGAEDPKVRVQQGDAIAALMQAPPDNADKYDAILLDLPSPSSISYSYYTSEVFEAVRQWLRPGGALGFSISASFCSKAEDDNCALIPSLLQTLQQSFPYASLGAVPSAVWQEMHPIFVVPKHIDRIDFAALGSQVFTSALNAKLSGGLTGANLQFYDGESHEACFKIPKSYLSYLKVPQQSLTIKSMKQWFGNRLPTYGTKYTSCGCDLDSCKTSNQKVSDEL